jgi:hypothetical protein
MSECRGSEGAEEELAYMDFAPAHWVKLHSTNPIERPNGEIHLDIGLDFVGGATPGWHPTVPDYARPRNALSEGAKK